MSCRDSLHSRELRAFYMYIHVPIDTNCTHGYTYRRTHISKVVTILALRPSALYTASRWGPYSNEDEMDTSSWGIPTVVHVAKWKRLDMEDKQDGGLCGRGFGKGGGGSRVSLGRTLENEKRGGTGGSASFWFSLTKPRLTNRISTSVSWSITPSRPRSSVSCTYTPSRLAQTIKQPNKQTRRISGIFIFIFIFISPVVQSSPPGSGGIITYAEDQIRSDRIWRRKRMARSRWGACFSNPLTALHWTALH